eukprot:TRINITY_DN3651_c0_g1_i2.p1 TRINITY_DN3651_c0_g1~~TRINITY_DN3651_c0_g1_i2.p1  ORF type:complete len:260 (-),score=24.74 TRINITY_DN3651_c0_g1_i2:105-884(-)
MYTTSQQLVKGTDPFLSDVKFHLRDFNPAMVSAWKKTFQAMEGVPSKHRDFVKSHFTISEGDIFQNSDGGLVTADAVVSPANSFGFMDGGIDLRFSKHFGWDMMERLQAMLLNDDYNGELLVGQAVILETHDERKAIPYLISAPTMRVPLKVDDSPNAYLAFRAVLIEVRRHNKLVSTGQKKASRISTVLCPGLGTAIGEMPFETCAYQMYKAYENVALGRVFPHTRLWPYHDEHEDLCKRRGASSAPVPKEAPRDSKR